LENHPLSIHKNKTKAAESTLNPTNVHPPPQLKKNTTANYKSQTDTNTTTGVNTIIITNQSN